MRTRSGRVKGAPVAPSSDRNWGRFAMPWARVFCPTLGTVREEPQRLPSRFLSRIGARRAGHRYW